MQIDKLLIRILILALPFYFIRFSVGPVPTTVLEVLVYIVFLIFLFARKIDLKGKADLLYPALIFVVAGLISAVSDPNLISGLGLWKAYFLDGLLIYMMIISSNKDEDYQNVILYSGILAASLSLLLYFVGVRTIDGRILDLDRLSPNYLAMFLSPILVIGLMKIRKNLNITNILALVLLALALILTGSRGTIIALLGAGIAGAFFYLKKIKFKFANLALAGAIIVALTGGYLVFKPDWSDHSRKATSSNIRYYIWKTSTEIIKDNPVFGVGLSNYQNYFSNLTKDRVNYPEFISPQALTAHNIFLQMFATGGIIFLLGFIYFLYQSEFYRPRNAITLAIIAILAYGLVDTPFFRNDLAGLFWILFALNSRHKFK